MLPKKVGLMLFLGCCQGGSRLLYGPVYLARPPMQFSEKDWLLAPKINLRLDISCQLKHFNSFF